MSTNHLVRFMPYITHDKNGDCHIALAVERMHCMACVRAIETMLVEQPDIIHARVNLSTGRLNLHWRGKAEHIANFITLIEKLGYGIKPYQLDSYLRDSQDLQNWLLRCLAVAGFATGNMMLISVILWTTDFQIAGLATAQLFHFLSALIGLPVICYSGQPFFHSAFSALKNRHTNMDVPISLAVILASGMSIFEMLQHGEHVYFDSAVMLLFFLLIGRYLDLRARGKARESAIGLLEMLDGSASVIEGGKQRSIAIQDLRSGMKVAVALGEKIPADGIVMSGTSDIDMSLITGETMPQLVKKGDKIYAGTLNISAPLTLEVAAPSEDSLLSSIVKLMEQAEQTQSHYVRLADRAAALYVPIVHTLALATFVGWWLLMGAPWQDALLYAVTLLIITCPCALGLAVPVVQVLASGWLMRNHIMLKSGTALEKIAIITHAIFDKTGTLTQNKPVLIGAKKHTKAQLQLAASLAAHSKHPLSQSLCAHYQGKLLPLDVKEYPGKGLQATYQGKRIRLGKTGFAGKKITDKASEQQQHSLVNYEIWLDEAGKQPLCFQFTDALRSDAKALITRLQKSGIHVAMFSGDRNDAVSALADSLGITDFCGEMLPEDKGKRIAAMQAEGANVLMVGDGLNDTPSLAMAHVSISPASAVDMAQNAADIVFQGEKLMPVLTAWHIGKISQSLVKSNFALAVIYNMIAVPLAILGLVVPVIAALAMSGSSLVVIANSFRLVRLARKYQAV